MENDFYIKTNFENFEAGKSQYSTYHVHRLRKDAIAAYEKVADTAANKTLPEIHESNFVSDKLNQTDQISAIMDYFAVIRPINRLVEMGKIDFKADTPLEEIINVLK